MPFGLARANRKTLIFVLPDAVTPFEVVLHQTFKKPKLHPL